MVDALQLTEGDEIESLVADDRVFKVQRKPGGEALLKKIEKVPGKGDLASRTKHFAVSASQPRSG